MATFRSCHAQVCGTARMESCLGENSLFYDHAINQKHETSQELQQVPRQVLVHKIGLESTGQANIIDIEAIKECKRDSG